MSQDRSYINEMTVGDSVSIKLEPGVPYFTRVLMPSEDKIVLDTCFYFRYSEDSDVFVHGSETHSDVFKRTDASYWGNKLTMRKVVLGSRQPPSEVAKVTEIAIKSDKS